MKTVPVIDVQGNPVKRGREQGEGARAQIHAALNDYREILPQTIHLHWEEVITKSLLFLPCTERVFPQYIEELNGIAMGADADFEEIWALNCYQCLTEMSQQVTACTCVAVNHGHTVNKHVFLAHNEDWLSVDQENIYLIRAKPDDGPAFLGMTYGPLLANIGINEAGIGVAINSVYSTDVRLGVPRVLYSRAILAATTMDEAIAACLQPERAGGYHFLLASSIGELYSVETSATRQDVIASKNGWLVHTNHYLSPSLQDVEEGRPYLSNSHKRFHRARDWLKPRLGSIALEDLQELMRDHTNHPDSICEHENPSHPHHTRSQTLISLIMDLTECVMWTAPSHPCKEAYIEHRL
jgi:isopenicillin-N N-acyltransferase-like protein